jgi:SSS family solute:Na+ symporter/sodium/proline symporter
LSPVLLAAFFWKRDTPQGGLVCISGGLVTIIGLIVLNHLGVSFELEMGATTFDFASSDYIVIPAVLVSIGLLLVVSLLTPASPDEKWSPFFESPDKD